VSEARSQSQDVSHEEGDDNDTAGMTLRRKDSMMKTRNQGIRGDMRRVACIFNNAVSAKPKSLVRHALLILYSYFTI
jgi:hypothetical protein